MSERKKVLVFIKGFGLGGAERVVADSLPYLNTEEFEFHFAYVLPHKNYFVRHIEQAGFPVYCLAPGVFGPLSVYRKLVRLLRGGRFDLVHAHLPYTGILARLAGWRCGVLVVYTEHNLQESYAFVTRVLNKVTYRLNCAVIAVSSGVADSLRRYALDTKTKVSVLPNAVPPNLSDVVSHSKGDVRKSLGINESTRVVGVVTVCRPAKLLGDWLDVAERVLSQRTDTIFVLVGRGPDKGWFVEEVARRGLTGRVLVPEGELDGRAMLSIMDVYLVTSRHEGMPIAVLEAMSAGMPTVATRVGGIPELIDEGVHGYLFEPGQTDRMASSVSDLVGDASMRLSLGSAARKKVASAHNTKDRVREIEQLYHQCLANH